jgi:hypothetical protein
VLINSELTRGVLGTRVYRGSDIGSDHMLAICKLAISTRWRKFKSKEKCKGKEIFKVHLLREDSIKDTSNKIRKLHALTTS